MNRLYQETLFGVCLRVVCFWWIILTGVAIGHNPALLLDMGHFFEAMYSRIWYIGAAFIAGVCLVGVLLLLLKEKVLIDLSGRAELGLKTTIGPVPMSVDPVKRIKGVSKRLPIRDKSLAIWLLEQNTPVDEIVPFSSVLKGKGYSREEAALNSAFREELNGIAGASARYAPLASDNKLGVYRKQISPHGRLFLAVWDVYCAHKHYPASHREGGHGSVSLHQHCLSVAARCLQLISPEGGAWKFDGIYVKRRGRNPVRLFENSTAYQPNLDDPLIPIIGLAHDLGKIDAYDVDDKGRIRKNREPHGNTLADDDRGVIHDILGPRILSRLPEFWELPAADRSAINAAVAHYHHPSKFPITGHGIISDFRAAALMMLMISADRAVSADEAGIAPNQGQSMELSEDEVEALYETFVQIICTPGRINGLGNPADDAAVRIGQKHADFIAIKMSALMGLVRKELGVSLESGEHKHTLTNQLLAVLKDKGLLYTTHKSVDFSLYNPMYRVGLYHHSTSKHFGDLAPALLLNIPRPEQEEFYSLTHLALNPATVVVKGLILSHIKSEKIKDRKHLEELIDKAFGAEGAKADVHLDVTDDPDGPMLTQTDESAQNGEGSTKIKSVEEVGNERRNTGDEALGQPHAPAEQVQNVLNNIDPEVLANARSSVKGRKQKRNDSKKSISVADLGSDGDSAVMGLDELLSAVPELEAPPEKIQRLELPVHSPSDEERSTPDACTAVSEIENTSGAVTESGLDADLKSEELAAAMVTHQTLSADDEVPSLDDDDGQISLSDDFYGESMSLPPLTQRTTTVPAQIDGHVSGSSSVVAKTRATIKRRGETL